MTTDNEHILRYAFPDLQSLKSAYMSFVIEGGIFIASKEDYQLGDFLKVSLTLPESNHEYSFSGDVIWISPKTHTHPGVGITCSGDEGEAFKKAILALIGDIKTDEKGPFETM